MNAETSLKAANFDRLMEALAPKKKEPKKKFDHEAAVMKYKMLLIKSGFQKHK